MTRFDNSLGALLSPSRTREHEPFGFSTLALSLAMVVASLTTGAAQPAVNRHAASVKAFQDRLNDYVALHERVAATLPSLEQTADPVRLTTRERELGDALMKARAAAKLGDVFGRELRPFLVRVIREDWAQRSPADRRALVGDLPRNLKVRVNMRYPATYPLLTFPSRLLAKLPDLPEQLEYRFFGRHLILRDTKANIVIDALLNALPATS